MKKQISSLTGFIIIAIEIAILFGGIFIYQQHSIQKSNIKNQNETAGWKTYSNFQYGFEIKYPEIFSGAVWRAQNWPPTITISDDSKNSITACGSDISLSDRVSFPGKITLNNIDFITYTGTGVGAGQFYGDYCYIIHANNRYYGINFLIHSTNGCGNGNCGPWCGTPNEQACKNFDMQKEVVGPIEQIVSTFKFNK